MTLHEPSRLFARDAALLAEAGLDSREINAVLDGAALAGVAPLEQAIACAALDERAALAALAKHLRLPFTAEPLPLSDAAVWPDAVNAGVAPLRPNPQGWRFAIAPRGALLRNLLAHDRRTPPSGLVATTPGNLARSLSPSSAPRMRFAAAQSLPATSPLDSARDGPGAPLIGLLLALVLALAVAMAVDARTTAVWTGIALGALFLVNVTTRVTALTMRRPAADDVADPPDHRLPVYTVLAPLYREAKIAHRLVAALRALDYPPAKLDIKFLVEADDEATRDALLAAGLAPTMEILVAPDGAPRTKPRALNLGLATARGDLVAVYDAEDRPHPRQLRDAAARFAREPAQVACLQARIAVENAHESWVTRLFALEYAALFGLFTPSLAAQHLPIALGGTSNHFRASALRAAGGWDAWNVTEDADLGLRLFRRGWRVGALASVTWEEAPRSFAAWLGQRTRWLKGWMQTSAVHLTAPRKRIRELGAYAAAVSLATSLGSVLSALFGPLFVAATAWEIAQPPPDSGYPAATLAIWAFALTLFLAGLLTTVVPAFVAARRHGLAPLTRWIPLLPFYYLLVSFAAWIALYELARRPHHWRKTEHGVSAITNPPP